MGFFGCTNSGNPEYTTEIDTAIASLPDDLYAAYENTLNRMARNMRSQSGKQELCYQALKWLACSYRAISVLELFTALSVGSKPKDILFTKEDLISVCGPLAVVRKDTIQLVHFSAKEYLISDRLADSIQLSLFFVDLAELTLP